MKKLLKARVWVLIIALVIAIFAISPNPWAEGVEIKAVRDGSQEALVGVNEGEMVVSVNDVAVKSVAGYLDEVGKIRFEEKEITVQTDRGDITFARKGDIGFIVENLTIKGVDKELRKFELTSAKLNAINGMPIESDEVFYNVTKSMFEKQRFSLRTNRNEYTYLITKSPELTVVEARKSNINKGLELQGGTRVVLRPVSDQEITENVIQDLIAVLSNRLNVYGLADMKINGAKDLEGNKFVVLEMAGISREEVKEVIAEQGKFEAKIGNETVFVGGKGDIPFVCRNDGTCAGIIPGSCRQIAENQFSCTFQFAIKINEAAAEKHAIVTDKLAVVPSEDGSGYLSEQIDFYLDGELVDSLNIGADLKGKETQDIAISGPGFGSTEESAYDDALKNMNKLQTILITGSLPLKLEVEKLDTISPVLGRQFVKNTILATILAIIAVALVLAFRYRNLKIVIPTTIVSISEVVLTLGVAALIQWNMDLASIAGIIAAVGTGVDDQIVIIDEIMKHQELLSWKDKIKRAFFIIMAAYVTTVAAMLPLWNAGAGLVRGFAVTTIIGITIGVFITRPAFGVIAEVLFQK